MHYILFIYSWFSEQLGCSHLLPIVNNALMNVGVQTPLWVSAFRSFGYISRSGTAGGDAGGVVAELCLTLATPRTVACQAPLSMGFSRKEYWNRLPFPSPGDLPNPGIKTALVHCRQILYWLKYERVCLGTYQCLVALVFRYWKYFVLLTYNFLFFSLYLVELWNLKMLTCSV